MAAQFSRVPEDHFDNQSQEQGSNPESLECQYQIQE